MKVNQSHLQTAQGEECQAVHSLSLSLATKFKPIPLTKPKRQKYISFPCFEEARKTENASGTEEKDGAASWAQGYLDEALYLSRHGNGSVIHLPFPRGLFWHGKRPSVPTQPSARSFSFSRVIHSRVEFIN